MPTTILIADDEAEITALLEIRLKKQGYTVLTSAAGTEVYKITQEKIPSLMILDVMLPELNGYEICRLLKADAYITKPFESEILLAKIKELLGE